MIKNSSVCLCINLARIILKVIYVLQSVGFNNDDNNFRNTGIHVKFVGGEKKKRRVLLSRRRANAGRLHFMVCGTLLETKRALAKQRHRCRCMVFCCTREGGETIRWLWTNCIFHLVPLSRSFHGFAVPRARVRCLLFMQNSTENDNFCSRVTRTRSHVCLTVGNIRSVYTSMTVWPRASSKYPPVPIIP